MGSFVCVALHSSGKKYDFCRGRYITSPSVLLLLAGRTVVQRLIYFNSVRCVLLESMLFAAGFVLRF